MLPLRICFAVLLVLASRQSLEGAPPALEPRLTMSDSADSHSPLWYSYEFVPTPSTKELTPCFYATLDQEPRVTLREVGKNKEVARLGVLPHWLATGTGSLGADVIVLDHGRSVQRRFLLNRQYGVIQPGEYELAVELYLEVTRERAAHLPGREAKEVGTISSASVPMVIWALPVQRATFRIMEGDEKHAAGVLARVEESAKKGRFASISVDDWLSLLLINNEPSWELLVKHLDQAPEEVRETAAIFLLNYGTAQEAIRRAEHLLSSDSWWLNRIAFDVIEQRGTPQDALLLHDYLRSESNNLRREAYFTLARMLGKPIPAELGHRPLNSEDVEVALGWLAELAASPPETRPATSPGEKTKGIVLPIPTQPAPASQPACTRPAR